MPNPRVEIRYCTKCRWMLRAAWLGQELLSTFEHSIGEVALVPGESGQFQVFANEKQESRIRRRPDRRLIEFQFETTEGTKHIQSKLENELIERCRNFLATNSTNPHEQRRTYS